MAFVIFFSLLIFRVCTERRYLVAADGESISMISRSHSFLDQWMCRLVTTFPKMKSRSSNSRGMFHNATLATTAAPPPPKGFYWATTEKTYLNK